MIIEGTSCYNGCSEVRVFKKNTWCNIVVYNLTHRHRKFKNNVPLTWIWCWFVFLLFGSSLSWNN